MRSFRTGGLAIRRALTAAVFSAILGLPAPAAAQGQLDTLENRVRQTDTGYLVQASLRDQLEVFIREGCPEAERAHLCNLPAVPMPAANNCDISVIADLELRRDAGGTAVRGALIVYEVVAGRQILADGSGEELGIEGRVSFTGIVLSDDSGEASACQSGTLRSGELELDYRLKLSDPNSLPILGAFLSNDPRDRSFFAGAICLLTGCEEHRSISVTIRGGARPLQILQDGAPTRRLTDQTFAMLPGAISKMAVALPSGGQRPVAECALVFANEYARTYDCGGH